MKNRFVVYNASAGSGKTFQIATHYLNKLIQAEEPAYVYRLLGITFTNKAAAEMKERVLQNLINASKGQITDVMAQVALQSEDIIKKQMNITSDKAYQAEIIKRSQQRLTEILHHYDDFQLTTIDKMMYKIIRTFARDMNLPVDVEVVLDHKEIIINLIDKLIAKAVRGEELTDFFINLSLNKVDEEKSWKIENDLLNINEIIFDDNYFTEIKSLENKNFTDFKRLKKKLFADNKQIMATITQRAEKFVAVYKEYETYVNGDFKSLIDKMFSTDKYFDVEIKPRLRGVLDQANPILYAKGTYSKVKKTNPELAQYIAGTLNDSLQQLSFEVERFINDDFKNLVEKYHINKGLLKQINALSIQKALLDEIEAYKDETHSIFISDFNKLILTEILKHLSADTPYIYMRLGEKYSHYLIDEFQDTSELQWHNLIPLIHEALSKEFSNEKLGDTMLVGDAKQSIYRFRGGKPEQFIALSEPNNNSKQSNPFKDIVDKKVENLAYNWRSESNIITFNNHFFETFTDYLQNPDYQKVYQNVSQEIPAHKKKDNGFVQIHFLEKEDKTSKVEDKNYALAVLDAIYQAEKNGFKRDEICVLIDRHAIGVEIAETLTRNHIDIISSETLLVRNSAKVQFLISWIRFLEKGATEDFYPAMHYLQEIEEFDNHDLYQKILKSSGNTKLSKQQRIESLQDFGYLINYERLIQMNLYDLAVYLIQQFKLNKTTDEQAYLQAFVEEIHQYYSKTQAGIRSFLLHWQNIEGQFSIKVGKQRNAVNIMTVHKSKGLEFPVVIYYTRGKMLSDKDKQNTVWINVNAEQFEGFTQLPVEMKVLEKSIDPAYQYLYEQASSERAFDNLNRLYVALTRASEQLFVILDPLPKNPKEEYNSIFNRFIQKQTLNLQSNDDQTYTFGKAKRQNIRHKFEEDNLYQNKLYFRNWQADKQNDSLLKINTKSFERWQEDKKNAVLYGMQLHDILSKIDTYAQWKKYKKKYIATVNKEEEKIVSEQIEAVLTQSELAKYYSDSYQILNERDILIPQENKPFSLRRPDRMVLKGNQISIIDYKTGAYNKQHEKQLIEYAGLLAEIGYEVKEKILVYIKNQIEIVKL